MNCPKCSKSLPRASVECPFCGVVLDKAYHFSPSVSRRRTPPREEIPPPSSFSFKQFILVSAIGIFGLAIWKHKSKQENLSRRLASMPRVTVYGPRDDRMTQLTREQLHLRGIRTELVELPLDQTLSDHPIVRRAQKENGGREVSLPLVELSDQLLPPKELTPLITALPVKNFREQASPYIVVWGPQDCPKTSRKMNELRAQGLPFEYHDVNAEFGRFTAKMEVSHITQFEFPIVEINGQMKTKLSAQEIATIFRGSP